jgi:hypothetical protein
VRNLRRRRFRDADSNNIPITVFFIQHNTKGLHVKKHENRSLLRASRKAEWVATICTPLPFSKL